MLHCGKEQKKEKEILPLFIFRAETKKQKGETDGDLTSSIDQIFKVAIISVEKLTRLQVLYKPIFNLILFQKEIKRLDAVDCGKVYVCEVWNIITNNQHHQHMIKIINITCLLLHIA